MSALLPDDLLLPDDDLAPVDAAGEASQPVVWSPARSGRVADPRDDGVVVP
jgi:hypothetical protein